MYVLWLQISPHQFLCFKYSIIWAYSFILKPTIERRMAGVDPRFNRSYHCVDLFQFSATRRHDLGAWDERYICNGSSVSQECAMQIPGRRLALPSRGWWQSCRSRIGAKTRGCLMRSPKRRLTSRLDFNEL